MPSFEEEHSFKIQGYRYIAGVDEAGRGCLAGPVVAGAVILPLDTVIPFIGQVRDSKKLTPRKRDTLFGLIRETAVAVGVGIVDFDVIDDVGIVEATRRAMKKAIEGLSPSADSLLIDYMKLPDVDLPQKGIVRGDDHSYSIACASIIAKVSRDRMMVELDKTYSGYQLAKHKGYGTRTHIMCLENLGPSPIHRRSFSPVRKLL